MNDLLDDLLPDWNLDEGDEPSEVERAYLFNDVGLLRYVIDIHDAQCGETADDLLPDA